MSGIVGIVNLEGAPVDRDLLRRMTDFMTFRGPDAQEIWTDGNVGFGHTMLRTTFEAETEHQPLTLDGKVWLTADARIDGRAELISELEAKLGGKLQIPFRSNGHGPDSQVPNDAELILYAYEAWGEDCVKHLIGDFAFAIWDARQRRLFCARDHFGVKPFYYAHLGNTFIFSNTLNCVRLHPDVSDELNDLAIADFLLFGANQEPATTTFAKVQRLSPAHSLTFAGDGIGLRRFWSLSAQGRINYNSANDYVERFREIFRAAVGDRLRTSQIGISMSGGLDSTAVAAVASHLLSENSEPGALRACSAVYDKVIPDEERHYSGIAAAALGITIDYVMSDNYPPFSAKDQVGLTLPEPFFVEPLGAISDALLGTISSHSRVALTGWDGDSVMNESPKGHFSNLFRNLRFGQLFADMSWFLLSRHQLPPVGFRTCLKRLAGLKPRSTYPGWLNGAFENRLDLKARWEHANVERSPLHNTRPIAHLVLSSALLTQLFEAYDPGVTFLPLEARHPIFDLRLVEYLLALPHVPWIIDKEILRAAMHDLLPNEVRLRPKSLLAGDPALEFWKSGGLKWLDTFEPAPSARMYIQRNAILRLDEEQNSDTLWTTLRAYALNKWLEKSLQSVIT